MNRFRQWVASIVMALACVLSLPGASDAQAMSDDDARTAHVIQTWYALVLELVRHTPTYTPPVASRGFAYIGVTTYEAVAAGTDDLLSLAGQLNGLEPLPTPDNAAAYDQAVVVQAAMANAAHSFFANTGPTGQRAMTAMETRLAASVADGLPPDVVARSQALGTAIAAHIIDWSASDGGAVIVNMGFPFEYPAAQNPGEWVPTNAIRQQQMPLLPDWGHNRTFAMPQGAACALPPPITYSEAAGSEFHDQALAVYQTTTTLTDDQRQIARFWSDDPMLSPTPPGHWIVIALAALEDEGAAPARQAEVLARLGVALGDAFIGCWDTKFQYNLLRPVTYIRQFIDPAWTPLLITPPFPEYPSGHSTQSGAAATVLTAMFGEDYAFDDETHVDDGLPVRSFPSFWAAAEEAGISRLYGGIHFDEAIRRGLDQGRCIGDFANTLVTQE